LLCEPVLLRHVKVIIIIWKKDLQEYSGRLSV